MSDRGSTAAAGWVSFAGFVMILAGGFAMLQGLGMLLNTDSFPGNDSVFSQSATTWGWMHLLIGAVVLVSGFGVFTGNVLARTVGVIAVTINALGAFVTIQFQPFWSLAIIIIDITVIWALTLHGRDVRGEGDLM